MYRSRHVSAKLGSPNDEVFHGHPLAGKGLEGYTAQLVRNSRWLSELQQINSVHAGYRPEAWQKRNHYVFWFHDTTFECIAEGSTSSCATARCRSCSRRHVVG